MLDRRPNPLTLLLLFASLVSIIALGAVCGVAVVSLHQLSEVSDSALQRQVSLLKEATALQSLLYQKGIGTHCMLTRERRWLSVAAPGAAPARSGLGAVRTDDAASGARFPDGN